VVVLKYLSINFMLNTSIEYYLSVFKIILFNLIISRHNTDNNKHLSHETVISRTNLINVLASKCSVSTLV